MSDVGQKLPMGYEVLVPFTRGAAQQLSAPEIAEYLKLNKKTTARKLDGFTAKKLINCRRQGRNKLYYLNLDHPLTFSLLLITESYKEINFAVNNPSLGLLFQELSSPLVLFGSYAKGRAKAHSDIDLIIFGKRNARTDRLISNYPGEVNHFYFTYKKFEKELAKKQHLMVEVAKDHIIFGEKERFVKILMGYWKK